MDNIPIIAVSHDYNEVMPFDLQAGRYFTEIESIPGKILPLSGRKLQKIFSPDKMPWAKKLKFLEESYM